MQIRTEILIAALLLLAFAACSGGCLSGSSVPGPATAVVPPSVIGDMPTGPGVNVTGDTVPDSGSVAAGGIHAQSLPADRLP